MKERNKKGRGAPSFEEHRGKKTAGKELPSADVGRGIKAIWSLN